MLGKLLDFKQEGNRVSFRFEKGEGSLTPLKETVFRVFSGDSTIPSKAVEKTENEAGKAPCTEVCREEGGVRVSTRRMFALVGDDFSVDFYWADGSPLCREYRGERTLSKGPGEEERELMAGEGHFLAEEKKRHKIEVLKAIEGDECFYGLGDKTGFLNKRHYAYDMWNTDNPDPQVDSFRALYKSIPFFMACTDRGDYGIFFDTTYKSVFDMGKESRDYYYFAADEGNLDYYFIGGDTLPEILTEYTALTGRAPLPQLWTLGYHQSRWSYKTEEEVQYIGNMLRKLRVPCDSIHLDIDYMERYKVFTWDKERFPDPKGLLSHLGEEGFKIVTIIDPGVKVEEGYPLYEEGMKKGYFATAPSGETYVNAVWPGDSVFPDFGNPQVRAWWARQQKLLTSVGVRGVWNDMNEPATFRGEIPGDVVFSDEGQKADHTRMHNAYGHLMAKATYEGLKEADGSRPFVITRACYAGTQKYSTAWTGDNHSIWAHLQMAVPQLCNLSLSGMPFVGTDIAGFGSDATPELLLRWVETGCFSPLFRNHCCLSAVRQEPWAFGKDVLDIYRSFVELRYTLIPYYYDLFREEEQTGRPILRPLVFHYEKDPETWEINDQFLIGDRLLAAPVLQQGARRRIVYLPEGTWYDFWKGEAIEGKRAILQEAPLDTCPLYVKAGSILPRWPVQQYVGEKEIRQLILDIYPGEGGCLHYRDDGESFGYREGAYAEYRFAVESSGRFTAELLHEGYTPYESLLLRCRGKEIRLSLSGEGRAEAKLW